MAWYGQSVALNSTFALSNVVTDLFATNIKDWRYASNTAFWSSNTASWTSNTLSNYNKATDQIFGSNTASWVSNMLSNYALSNGQSNWNWGSNTANFCSNTLSNYAMFAYQSNWVYASNVARTTSNLMYPAVSNWNYASNTAGWASNKVNWTSNALPNFLHVATQSNWDYASNTASWASNEVGARGADWDVVSNMARWTSNVLSNYALSNGQSNWNWASNTARWGSNEIGTRDSNWDYASNTAFWGSNATKWASNEVGTRDSNWDYGSNTARWASNEIGTRDSNWDYASNMASWGSNAAKWGSNEVGTRDSNWDYGSNTARWASNEVGTRDSNWDYGSNTGRWASNEIGTRDSNWDYGSNTAFWGSNAAKWASNEVGMRDSNWDYGSNTARWASNFAMTLSNQLILWANVNVDPYSVANDAAAYGTMTFNVMNSNVSYIDYTGRGTLIVNNNYLSNTARWASNTGNWTSNILGDGITDWNYASNTARWASNLGMTLSNKLANWNDVSYWTYASSNVTTSSNVGIGTNAPIAALDVRGRAYFGNKVGIGASNMLYEGLYVHRGFVSIATDNQIAQINFATTNADPARSNVSGAYIWSINEKTANGVESASLNFGIRLNDGTRVNDTAPGIITLAPNTPRGRILFFGYSSLSLGLNFEVAYDSVGKPGSSTWSVMSDERVKEDIVLADTDTCYNNVKRIPLKYFKWRDEYFTKDHISDRHKIGWIAQDVEKVFPKAVRVSTDKSSKIPECRTLDTDQLYATMYGAIQKLQEMCERYEKSITVLQAEVNYLKTKI